MKGDFTRLTWDPAKRYSSVRMQQGRVQTDADWNEQVEIDRHLLGTALSDVIGECCAPEEGGGFGIEIAPGGRDLEIGEGRMYAHGTLCEVGPEVTLLTQDDLPLGGVGLDDAPGFEGDGTYLVYLDTWQRHITALEDPEIRETALGGPDTATRTRTVSQVRLRRLGDQDLVPGCDGELPAPPSGQMRARTRPEQDDLGPCVVPASAGYTRIENQLYRVEIHQGGDRATATCKWSRDNGTIVSEWLGQDGDELRVRSTGRDDVLSFHGAAWVELSDDERELRGEPGILVRVVRVEGDVIEIDPGAEVVSFDDFGSHPKVRRWDMSDETEGALALDVAVNEGYLRLEGGVEVRFEDGTYQTGDYWLIPARAFIGAFAGDIEWPGAAVGSPEALLPRGIEHHYCRLASVRFADGEFRDLVRCLDTFPPLCELEPGTGRGCCCTASVGEGGDFPTLQAALANADPGLPLKICLLPGDHVLGATVVVARDLVVIHGCGRLARVLAPADGPAFAVTGGTSGVVFEDLFVVLQTGAGLEIGGFDVRVERNRFTAIGAAAPGGPLTERGVVELVAGARQVRISENVFEDYSGQGVAFDTEPQVIDASGFLIEDVEISGNRMLGLGGSGIVRASEIGAEDPVAGIGTLQGTVEVEGSPLPGVAVTATNVTTGFQLAAVTDAAGRFTLPQTPAGEYRVRAELVGVPGIETTVEIEGGETVDLEMRPEGVIVTVVGAPEESGPAPIFDLRIEGNEIRDSLRLVFRPRSDGAPQGGIILGHLTHLAISHNRIENNGTTTSADAVPVAGIFVEDCQGLEIHHNVVVHNGPDPNGVPVSGDQGGIVGLDLSAVVEEITDAAGATLLQTDGWPAAAVLDNLVSAPRRHALRLSGMGAMQIRGNRLTSRDATGEHEAVSVLNFGVHPVLQALLVAPAFVPNPLLNAAAVVSEQVSGPVARAAPDTVGGHVDFSGNQVRFDAFFGSSGSFAVLVGSLDDLAFSDNQTRCSLGAEDSLLSDVMLFGATLRASSNGLYETLGRALFSLYGGGYLMSTASNNQGTHCVRSFQLLALPTITTSPHNNLELFCQAPSDLLDRHVFG